MKLSNIRIVAAVIVITPALNANAQVVRPLSIDRAKQIIKTPVVPDERAVQPKPGDDPVQPPPPPSPECAHYFAAVPRPLAPEAPGNSEIASCLETYYEALRVANLSSSGHALNDELIELRVAFKTLKKWFRGDLVDTRESNGEAPPDLQGWLRLRDVVARIEKLLPEVLKKHGLFAPFSAILVTGATLADASQSVATETTTPGDDAEQKGGAVGMLIWQSRHYGDESLRSVDIALGGKIGIQPVLLLVSPAAGTSEAEEAATATHQNAFAWTLGVTSNLPWRSINAELGFYGRTGSTTLIETPTLVDRGAGSYVAFPLDGGVNKTAWLWEAGIEFNIFDTRLEQIHAEKGATSPQFHASIAYRRDERFGGASYGDFINPKDRLVFRFSLDAIKVVDKRQFGEAAKPFTFGFAVEHERSLSFSGSRLPSATRFILRGDINLLKALTSAPAPQQTQ